LKFVAYLLAVLLGLLGFVFVTEAQGQWMRLAVGVVLMCAAVALVLLARHQAKHVTTIVQKIDLPGDVHLEGLTCRSCGGSLGKESISVKAGAVFIDCEFCGTAYQLDEEPKW